MEGCRSLRKDRKRRQVGGVALYINDSWSACSLTWGWMRSSQGAYGSGLKGWQGQVPLHWGSARASQTGKVSTRSSTDRLEQPHIHVPCEFLTVPCPHGELQPLPAPVRGTKQQGTGNPGDSWNVLTSFSK